MQWSPVKEQAFAFETDLSIIAGAGTGKTSFVCEGYRRLLAGETSLPEKLSVEQIVAITFTDKAAVEMKERIRSEVKKLSDAGDVTAEWDKILRALSVANISTFHSFCSRILREHPAEAGIDPSFIVFDEMASTAEMQAALDEVIGGELAANSADITLLLDHFPLNGLGKQGKGLREYIVEIHGRRAGSDKTDEDVLRIAEECDAEAGRGFAFAFESLGRAMDSVHGVLEGKELVFHKALRPILKIYDCDKISIDGEETPAMLDKMKECIAGNWGKERDLKNVLVDSIEQMLLCYYQRKSRAVMMAFLNLLAKFERAYANAKDRFGALDFEDLQVRTCALLEVNEGIRDEYRERFAVFIVDEYQDTNPLQKKLLSLLCGPKQRLLVVGDPKQSIYLFRGADVSVSVSTRQEIEARGGRAVYFQESFRSRQGIIEFVNRIFTDVMTGGPEPFQIAYEAGDVLDPQRKDWDEQPCVELITIDSDQSSSAKRIAEASTIARKIKNIVSGDDPICVFSQDRTTHEHIARQANYGDIAILFRRFSNLKVFEYELRKAGVPYYVVKGKGFYSCQEVLDILSFLRFIEYGEDLGALLAVLRSPFCGVSDETLYLQSTAKGGIRAWASRIGTANPVADKRVWGEIDEADRDRISALSTLIADLRESKDRLTLAELIEALLHQTDYMAGQLTCFQGEQRAANIKKLIEMSRTFVTGKEGNLRRFVNYLTKMVEEQPSEAEAVVSAENEQVVRIMTIHQSKGLEFPITFLPELGASQPVDNSPVKYDDSLGFGFRLPSAIGESSNTLSHKKISDLRHMKESAELLRLFYVALTRARDYLIMSGEGRGEWRKWVDAFAAAHPDFIKLTAHTDVVQHQVSETLPLAVLQEEEVPTEADVDRVKKAIFRAVVYEMPLPHEMTFSPTVLRDFVFCQRKYYYKEVLGLDDVLLNELLKGDEFKVSARLTPIESGGLVHKMLEAIDFSDDEETIRRVCRRMAYLHSRKHECEDVDVIIDAVIDFVRSDLGRAIASMPMEKEYPFILRLQGYVPYIVKGVMDLVVDDGEFITVYDYKYLEKESADLEDYRFQVGLYMLALSKGFPNRGVRGRILFLKGAEIGEIEIDLEEFEAEILDVMDSIRIRRGEGEFAVNAACDDRFCPFGGKCGRACMTARPSVEIDFDDDDIPDFAAA